MRYNISELNNKKKLQEIRRKSFCVSSSLKPVYESRPLSPSNNHSILLTNNTIQDSNLRINRKLSLDSSNINQINNILKSRHRNSSIGNNALSFDNWNASRLDCVEESKLATTGIFIIIFNIFIGC